MIAPQPKPAFKYITPSGVYVGTYTNCSGVLVYDSTEDALVLDIDMTGDAAGSKIEFLCQLPADFLKFAGGSDDVAVRAIQDAVAASLDITLTIDVLDASGADADDDTVDGTALTGSYATYDCAITGGTFSAGDFITIRLTLPATTASGDGCRIGFPKIKYVPN